MTTNNIAFEARSGQTSDPVGDSTLIAAVLKGDIDRYGELLKKYDGMVFALVIRRVPADAVDQVAHDVFLRAFRALAQYRPDASFSSWLTRIAIRTCCDYWREQMRHRRRQVFPPPSEEQRQWFDQLTVCRTADEADQLVRRSDAGKITEWLLGQLSPEDRTLMESVYIDGMRLKDVAAALDWSLIKTKVRAMRARRKMRQLLESIGEIS